VAAALAAVHAQAMSLPQAAAMVIGMDLGTTGSAALATIGGTVRARRTGFAHVIFNSMTAVGAFFLLTPYLAAVDRIWPGASAGNPEFVLVGFHSFFNLIGALGVLPVTDRFAALITRLFPERGNPLTRRLDLTLLSTPAVALQAVSATLLDLFRTVARMTSVLLEETVSSADILDELPDIEEAITATRDYLQNLTIPRNTPEQLSGYLAAMHILDHLGRLCRRLHDAPRRGMRIQEDHDLRSMAELLRIHAAQLASADRLADQETRERLHALNASLKSGMRAFRQKAVGLTAERALTASAALARMDAARWLRRIGYHYWRIAFHLGHEELTLASPPSKTDNVAPQKNSAVSPKGGTPLVSPP
jgi:phosphate:Na+ symporter